MIGFGRLLRTGLSSLRDRAANLRRRLAALRFNPSRGNRLRENTNEYGTPVAHFRCRTCDEEFSITPAPPPGLRWEDCGSPECASYDESRDVSKWFRKGKVRAIPDGEGGTRLVPFKVIEGGVE